MLASPATEEPSVPDLNISSDALADKRVRQECGMCKPLNLAAHGADVQTLC